MSAQWASRLARQASWAACAAPAPAFQRAKLASVGPKAQVFYGGRHTVTLLPGDGIGPELTDYVKEVFDFIGVPVDFEEVEVGAAEEAEGLGYAVTSVLRNGVALKGSLGASGEEAGSWNARLRKELQLYVNEVRCTSYPGVNTRHADVDVVLVRQNTEGFYAMLEHESVAGVVESMKITTRANAERAVRYAFEYAERNARRKVTTVHKANIMKLSDGLFLETAREVAREYPAVLHEDMIVDNACMQLVRNPRQFDMFLTTNLYGAVLSNVLCGLLGGAGLFSGHNIGERCMTFEPAARSSASGIAGRNIANPMAMLNAAVDMLRHLGRQRHADLIERGIYGCIAERIFTRDLGGKATSRQVVNGILRHVELTLMRERPRRGLRK